MSSRPEGPPRLLVSALAAAGSHGPSSPTSRARYRQKRPQPLSSTESWGGSTGSRPTFKWVAKVRPEPSSEAADAPEPAAPQCDADGPKERRAPPSGGREDSAYGDDSTAAEERSGSEQASVTSTSSPRGRGEVPAARISAGAPRWADEPTEAPEATAAEAAGEGGRAEPESPLSPRSAHSKGRRSNRQRARRRAGAAADGPTRGAQEAPVAEGSQHARPVPGASQGRQPTAARAPSGVVTLGDLGLSGLGPAKAQQQPPRQGAALPADALVQQASESWGLMSTSPTAAARAAAPAWASRPGPGWCTPGTPMGSPMVSPVRTWPLGDASTRAAPPPTFSGAAGADASARVAPVPPYAMPMTFGDASARRGDASTRASPLSSPSSGFAGGVKEFFPEASTPLWGTTAPAVAPLPEVSPAAPAAGAGGAERAGADAAPAGPALQTWLSASGLGASGDIAARLRAAAPEVYED